MSILDLTQHGALQLCQTINDILKAIPKDQYETMGAVNWGDLKVVDIERVSSLLYPNATPFVRVCIEEADPGCRLPRYILAKLEAQGVETGDLAIVCDW